MPKALSAHAHRARQASRSLNNQLIISPVRKTILDVTHRIASEGTDLLIVFLAQIFFYFADIFHIRTLIKYK